MAQQILPLVNIQKMYVAKILTETNDTATFDTPRYLEGIKEFGVKLKSASDSYYDEGRKKLDETTLSDIDITINITDLSDEDNDYVLGHKLAKEGGVIKNIKDIAPELAILIKANKAKGVDRYLVFYAGKFQEPDSDIKDKEGKTNFQSLKLQASFRALKNGLWSWKIDSDSENASTIIPNFFKQVTLPTPKTV